MAVGGHAPKGDYFLEVLQIISWAVCAVALRHPHVIEPDIRVHVRSHSGLLIRASDFNAFGFRRNINEGKIVRIGRPFIGGAHHPVEVSHFPRVCRPDLVPVDYPLIAFQLGRGLYGLSAHPADILDVGTAGGLRHGVAAHIQFLSAEFGAELLKKLHIAMGLQDNRQHRPYGAQTGYRESRIDSRHLFRQDAE